MVKSLWILVTVHHRSRSILYVLAFKQLPKVEVIISETAGSDGIMENCLGEVLTQKRIESKHSLTFLT